MYQAIKFRLRLLSGGWLHTRMRGRSLPWPVRPNRTTLVFEPHPDDGVLGCGGLISRRIQNGEIVHIATITDGAASHPGHPLHVPGAIAAIRANETRTAAAIIGVPSGNLHFLNAPDGKLPHLEVVESRALIQHMRLLIEKIGPSEVFITSRHDGSSEHSAAHALVAGALNQLPDLRPRLLEYIVWSQWSPRLLKAALQKQSRIYRHTLSPVEHGKKKAAVLAYRSQIEPTPPWIQPVLPAGFIRLFQSNEEYFFEF